MPVKCNLPKASGLSKVILALDLTNSISPHFDHLSAFPASKAGSLLPIKGMKDADDTKLSPGTKRKSFSIPFKPKLRRRQEERERRHNTHRHRANAAGSGGHSCMRDVRGRREVTSSWSCRRTLPPRPGRRHDPPAHGSSEGSSKGRFRPAGEKRRLKAFLSSATSRLHVAPAW